MTSIPTSMADTNTYVARDLRVITGWGPIMMGAICAIGLQFIFTVLGIALGASAGDTTDVNTTSVRTVGVAAGLWWLITGTIALAVGGFVFGRMSGLPRSIPLKLEAATLWGVVALFGFLVVWSGAGMLSQAASPIATAATAYDAYNTPANRGSISERGTNGVRDLANAATSPTTTQVNAEDARRAARNASWWSVVGLLVGLVATVSAAAAAVPKNRLP
ncbi:MAG: hypothetical protein JSS51_01240 [Planctomycetes bacterium]|nr:hypothetical protein [Planctomycetota bacterium]